MCQKGSRRQFKAQRPDNTFCHQKAPVKVLASVTAVLAGQHQFIKGRRKDFQEFARINLPGTSATTGGQTTRRCVRWNMK